MFFKRLKIPIVLCLLITLSSCSVNHHTSKKIGVSLWIDNDDFQKNYEGFIDGLKLIGYEEGKNLQILTLNPEGNLEKHRQAIESFKKENVDLIFTRGSSATLAAKEIAPNIPIIFSIVTFPVEVGILDCMNNASNKIAGTSNHVTIDHQYKIFHRLIPNLRSLAFIRSKNGQPNSTLQFQEFKSFLANKDIEVKDFADDNLDVILKMLRSKAENYDAIYGACDAVVQHDGEEKLAKLAIELSKPSFSCNKSSLAKGFMAALVPDYYELGKEAGFKAGEILKSNKKVFSTYLSTPVLNINTNVADKLGIIIPEDLKRKANLLTYPINE